MGNARNIAFWVVLFLLVLALFNLFENGTSNFTAQTVPFSDFIAKADNGEVVSVTLDGESVRVVAKDGTRYTTIRPQGEQIAERADRQGRSGAGHAAGTVGASCRCSSACGCRSSC